MSVSINLSIYQSIYPSIYLKFNQSTDHFLINRAINQTVNKKNCQSINMNKGSNEMIGKIIATTQIFAITHWLKVKLLRYYLK